jgi:hypothetical protein
VPVRVLVLLLNGVPLNSVAPPLDTRLSHNAMSLYQLCCIFTGSRLIVTSKRKFCCLENR